MTRFPRLSAFAQTFFIERGKGAAYYRNFYRPSSSRRRCRRRPSSRRRPSRCCRHCHRQRCRSTCARSQTPRQLLCNGACSGNRRGLVVVRPSQFLSFSSSRSCLERQVVNFSRHNGCSYNYRSAWPNYESQWTFRAAHT